MKQVSPVSWSGPMYRPIITGVLSIVGIGVLSACSGTGEDSWRHRRPQRPVYSFQNVDTKPNLSGEEYRNQNSDPSAPYASTDPYPNDDGSGIRRR